MNTIGLWQIAEAGPARLTHSEVSVEKDLEDWIEQDPSLLEHGLVIVGRQIRLEGGPLDLLALDPQGRWVLIEIKRERLRRDVIAQAIDYASCLYRHDRTRLQEQCDAYLRSKEADNSLTDLLAERSQSLDDETNGRDIVIYLVGTGIDAGLERMVEYLAERAELSVRLVTFSTFKDEQSRMLLAREIHESVAEPLRVTTRRLSSAQPEIEVVLEMADNNGLGGVIRPLYNTAMELGIQARPYARSIMFTPSANRTRCLFVVSVERRQRQPGVSKAYISAEAFEQFYGINEKALSDALNLPSGEVLLDQSGAEQLCEGLQRLIALKDRM